MNTRTNERLCVAAQKGDIEARDLLLENNMGFIRKTANEVFLSMNLGESDLGIEKTDLEQEGCLGLLDAAAHFDSKKGIKFLTYAAPAIRNAMTDLIRDAFSGYEQRMTDTKNGLGLQKIRLDELVPGVEKLLRMEAIADPIVKSPEQIIIEQETMEELYAGLGRIRDREQEYILYRYGFVDDVEHTLIGTSIHFSLSESRAKITEELAMDNLRLELLWWYEQQKAGFLAALIEALFAIKKLNGENVSG